MGCYCALNIAILFCKELIIFYYYSTIYYFFVHILHTSYTYLHPMASQNASFDEDSLSTISSTLSTAPATTILHQIDNELGGMGSPAERTLADNGHLTQQAPKQRNIGGKLFIETIVDRKRLTAWFWAHGNEYECQQLSKSGQKDLYWVCNHCRTFKAYRRSGSTHIAHHLNTKHRLQQHPSTIAPQSVLELQQNAVSRPHNHQLSDIDNLQLQKAEFERILVSWVTCSHIPFTVVESPYFQRLLTMLSERSPLLLQTSHNSLKASVMKDFARRRALVKSWIHRRKSTKIHLSFDLWSSPNGYGMLAIVAHFVSDRYTLEAPLLSLRSLDGPHSGANQAGAIQSTMKIYNLHESAIGCFVLDNAYNNDTCIRQLGIKFGWSPNEATQRRLRCFGHIINLAAQAYLFGEKDEAFEESLRTREKELKAGQLKLWELCGPIGKLHYIVAYIRRTPQRRQAFKKLQGEFDAPHLDLVCDNATRWNSAYRMIQRAFQLQDQIKLYCFQHTVHSNPPKQGDDGLIPAQILSQNDWLILTHLYRGLEYFHHATLRLEGAAKQAVFGSVWECVPIMELLLQSLTDLQEKYPNHQTFETLLDEATIDPATEFMNSSINCAFIKLRKYYDLMDNSPYWVAACILHPFIKWKYLEQRWEDKPQWITDGRKKVTKLWLQYKTASKDAEPTSPLPFPLSGRDDVLEQDLYAWRYSVPTVVEDEYAVYCSEPPLPYAANPNLLEEWRRMEGRFPVLAKMAFDILSIPAMSAECERIFSSAKHLLTDSRNKLLPESIEAVECERNWISHGYGVE